MELCEKESCGMVSDCSTYLRKLENDVFLRAGHCGAYISVIYLYNSCIMWFSDVTRVCKTFVVLFDTKMTKTMTEN